VISPQCIVRRTAVVAIFAATLISVGAPAAAAPRRAVAPGQLYVLQGLPGQQVDVYVNNQRVGSDVAAKTVLGPMSLAPGSYGLKITNAGATTTVLERALTVAAGRSMDAVVHLDSQATPVAKLTVFGNDISAVNAGKTRLAIAHTADVPPADIRVDGKVLFSNVANGEGLTTVVPAATYRVDVVPTGTAGPAILGPADFALKAGTLTRVFAIGQPARHNMDAIVQVLAVDPARAGQPTGINTGSGGRAAATSAGRTAGLGWVCAGLGLLGFIGYRVRSRRSVP
jgi:hypothetical protein